MVAPLNHLILVEVDYSNGRDNNLPTSKVILVRHNDSVVGKNIVAVIEGVLCKELAEGSVICQWCADLRLRCRSRRIC